MSCSRLTRAVVEIERRSVAIASELDPSAVPLAEAGRLYDRLDRAARALATAKALLAPRVAESREWQRAGRRSPEEDLAVRSGTSLAAAKSSLATGKALAHNRRLRSAMGRGELSPEQGNVIADATRADPDAIDKLIDTAKKAGLGELRNQAGRVKAAADKDPEATHRRLHQARRLSRFTHPDGSRHLHLQGPVDLVSIIEAELDRCLSHHIRNLVPGRPIESRDAMAFDAAITMARRSAHADGARGGGHAGTGPSARAHPGPGTDGGLAPADRGAGPDPGAGTSPSAGNHQGTPANARPGPGTDGGPAPADRGAGSDQGAGTSPSADNHQGTPANARPGPGTDGHPAPADPGAGKTPADRGDAGPEPPVAPQGRDSTSGPIGDSSSRLEAPGRTSAQGAGDRPGLDRHRGDAASTAPDTEVRPERPRAKQPAPEHLALLRIDIEALWRGHLQGDEICEIAGLGPFPLSAARRLLGDAVVKLIMTKGDAVAHVTSLTRGPTQAMRYALLWTSPECSAEGCTRTILQADHRYGAEHRLTRHTRLDELDALCHAHHALHTHHDWALITGTGKRPMVAPSDPRHPRHTAAARSRDRDSPGPTRSGPPPPGSTRQQPKPGRPATRSPRSPGPPRPGPRPRKTKDDDDAVPEDDTGYQPNLFQDPAA